MTELLNSFRAQFDFHYCTLAKAWQLYSLRGDVSYRKELNVLVNTVQKYVYSMINYIFSSFTWRINLLSFKICSQRSTLGLLVESRDKSLDTKFQRFLVYVWWLTEINLSLFFCLWKKSFATRSCNYFWSHLIFLKHLVTFFSSMKVIYYFEKVNVILFNNKIGVILTTPIDDSFYISLP